MKLDHVCATRSGMQTVEVLRDQGELAAASDEILLERRERLMRVVRLRSSQLFSPVTGDCPKRFRVDARDQAIGQLRIRRPQATWPAIRPEPGRHRDPGAGHHHDLARLLFALREGRQRHGSLRPNPTSTACRVKYASPTDKPSSARRARPSGESSPGRISNGIVMMTSEAVLALPLNGVKYTPHSVDTTPSWCNKYTRCRPTNIPGLPSLSTPWSSAWIARD